MAKTVIVRGICDRCKAEGNGEVDSSDEVAFSFDGYAYGLDLCAPHAEEFHTTLQEMMTWSTDRTRVAGPRRARSAGVADTASTASSAGQPARRDKEQIGAIRDWANSNGFKVSNRGRIPADVEAAYSAAH